MVRTWCFAFSFLCFIQVLGAQTPASSGSAAPGGAAMAQPPNSLEANAALKYWQAFATMPQFPEAEQNKIIAEFLTMPLDDKAREILAKSEYALRMMHHATKFTECEWGIDWRADGVETMLPQMSASRLLTSLASLRARSLFEGGKPAAATEDIIAAMRLGRQISRDGSILGALVGYSIEHRMSSVLALYLPKLDAKVVADFNTRYHALPPEGSLAAGVRLSETKSLDWFLDKVKSAKDTDDLVKTLAPFGAYAPQPEGGNSDALATGRALLNACGGNAAGVLKFGEETRTSYALMADRFGLPLLEFEKEYERETARQANNPIFQLFFPSLAMVRRAKTLADVRRALLLAATAMQQGKKDALKNYPDPATGSAFERVNFAGGYELRSKFLHDDQPVTLIVGRKGT